MAVDRAGLTGFALLKTKLTSVPLQVYHNFKEVIIVDCKASNDDLDAVMSSQNHQGAKHVLYYASRTLTKVELVY